jgi:dihydroneopterin aldolase
VASVVQRFVEQKQFRLIETMAAGLARKIYSLGNSVWVKVVVHKPAAAKALLLEDITAEAEVSR